MSYIRKYMTKVVECQDKSTKKRKLSSGGQQNIYNYHDSTDFPDSRITRINRALIKFLLHATYHSELLNIRSS